MRITRNVAAALALLLGAGTAAAGEAPVAIGGFVDARLDTLSATEIADLERLLDVEDQKAFSWLCGTIAPEAGYDTPLFRQIKQFHSHSGPVNV